VAEFGDQYDRMISAMYRGYSDPAPASEAVGRTKAAMLELLKAISTTYREATTLCPGYARIIK
jgi:hypothetical protein